MSNALRTGHATDDPVALKTCDVVLIALPDAKLDWWLPGLHDATLLICDSLRDSGSISLPGAKVVTFNAVDPAEKIFAIEGNASAIAILHRFLARAKRKTIELQQGMKPLFLAAASLASQLILSPYGASVEAFRAAGFSRAQATHAAQALAIPAIRAYGRAGRKAWNAHAQHLPEVAHDEIADVYRATLDQALRYFTK
jgi:hypothetical protein